MAEQPVDELFTRVVDSDEQWGPLLFIRPPKDTLFGIDRVLALAVLVGGGFGVPGSVLLALIARAADRPPLPLFVFPVLLTIVYFSICLMSIVPAWNRRARALRSLG
ncbi:MAG TPA: hypothetical protein VJV79_04415 [Polyangiaceae bacterium]|nr:hypothetical protein [Polyangiaceae bacterium]